MATSLRELEVQVLTLRTVLEELHGADVKQQDQLDTLTSAVDRFSLAVLGDDQLGVKGLVRSVEELKNESMSTKLAKAKWAGAGVALVMLAKGLWTIGVAVLSK